MLFCFVSVTIAAGCLGKGKNNVGTDAPEKEASLTDGEGVSVKLVTVGKQRQHDEL